MHTRCKQAKKESRAYGTTIMVQQAQTVPQAVVVCSIHTNILGRLVGLLPVLVVLCRSSFYLAGCLLFYHEFELSRGVLGLYINGYWPCSYNLFQTPGYCYDGRGRIWFLPKFIRETRT